MGLGEMVTKVSENGSNRLDFVDAGGSSHSLKLLKRNVIAGFNGYICSCGRLFVSSGIHVAKLDHGCWREHRKVEVKPTCVYKLRWENF
jgi:hypothetical protein